SEMFRLRELATHAGIGEKVIFVGQQSRDRLKYYYSASEIFITTPWYEPFGITPLEAMACGTPVIGSDVGGISYTVRHGKTGLLVPPRSPQKLAEALVALYTDKARRMEMKQYAIPYVKNKFTWETVSDQIQELYDQLIPICQQ